MSSDVLREQSEAVVSLMGKLMRQLFTMEADDPGMDLPIAQMRVCSVLIDGPKTMGAMSKELGITHSAITQIADRLERGGVVERVPESEDRRCKSLRLTDRGKGQMRSRRERRVSHVSHVLAGLGADERQSVVTALQTLLEAGRAANADLAQQSVSPETLVS